MRQYKKIICLVHLLSICGLAGCGSEDDESDGKETNAGEEMGETDGIPASSPEVVEDDDTSDGTSVADMPADVAPVGAAPADVAPVDVEPDGDPILNPEYVGDPDPVDQPDGPDQVCGGAGQDCCEGTDLAPSCDAGLSCILGACEPDLPECGFLDQACCVAEEFEFCNDFELTCQGGVCLDG